MMENKEQFYTAGKFAKKAGVTIRTIRYYDKRGLLKPSEYSESGYRLYSEREFAKLQKILTLKYLGFSLEQIEETINRDSEENNLKKSLRIQRQILESKLSHISLIVKSISETEKMLDSGDALEWDSFVNIINAINAENIIIEQYKNSSNLKSRINLHDEYSTNKYGWHRWVFDKIQLEGTVLELGSGDGSLWSKNIDRIPSDCEVILSDISKGMVEDARRNLSQLNDSFKYEIVDAQEIPYEDSTFDVVIANHMLFYVKDRKKVFSEIKRVLKPRGRFYASTIGLEHMSELSKLAREFDERITFSKTNPAIDFGLENGEEQLKEWFEKIKLYRYEDSLEINEAEPIISYVLSTHGSAQEILEGSVEKFRKFISDKLRQNGSIIITKNSGLFEGVNIKNNIKWGSYYGYISFHRAILHKEL